MNTRLVAHLLRAIALAVTIAGLPLAAQRPTAAAMLQEAVNVELVAGDLDRAVEQYRLILERYATDRSVTAQALAYMGRAYEKLGRRDAQGAYERVVREYADQVEPAQFARARLRVLTEANATAGDGAAGSPTFAMLIGDLPPMRDRDAPSYDLSPSGDRVVLQRSLGDSLRGTRLYLSDRSGSLVRLLFEPQPPAWRSMPRWSPDGRWIAYLEQRVSTSAAPLSLWVVAPDGGTPRKLADSLPMIRSASGGMFWTPDSKGISLAGATDIRTIDLDGRVMRTVPFVSEYLNHVTGYSPDGRWLAVHLRGTGGEDESEIDVWVLPAEGGRAIQVTREKGFDGWPTFAADGRSVYFVSGRSGSSNIWQQDIDPASGLPRGDARPVTTYRDAFVKHPRVVGAGRRLGFVLVRRTSVIHVASPSNPAGARTVARGVHAALSPDGQTIYYAGEGANGHGELLAVPVSGGEPRRLARVVLGPPAVFRAFDLTKRGDAIAYFTKENGQNVLFTVPTAGGSPREITRFESREEIVPSWSPDGSRLAYATGNGLYTIAATGGEPTKLAHLYKWDGWMVRWSPDGEHIAAFGWTAPENPPGQPEVFNGLFVVPANGGQLRRLTPENDGGYKEALEWHPDSRRISYMDYGAKWEEDASREAYLDGRPSAPFADQPVPMWDYVGRWAPDGRHFYFISAKAGNSNPWGLFVWDADSRTTRTVWPDTAGNPGVAGPPFFSADGQVMAWSVQNDVRQLWIMEWPAVSRPAASGR